MKPMDMISKVRTTRILLALGAGAVLLSQAGCLQTRAAVKEQEEKVVLRKTVQNLQQTTADVNTRFNDIDDDIRKLNGRVESTEHKLSQLAQNTQKSDQAIEQRVQEMQSRLGAYQEAISKLDTQVAELSQALGHYREEAARAQSAAAAASSRGSSGGSGGSASGPYVSAEEAFKRQAWKDAILDYEKYRKGNPRGKQFAEATYKIGVSFQELGMTDEARAFYEEVVAKFPKTKESEKAAYRLKTLKKK